jgi:hypothetical protein
VKSSIPCALAVAALAAAALPGRAAAAAPLYVSAGAAADPACAAASQANPFATVAAALACAPSGATIEIGAGTFAGELDVTRNVRLEGRGAATVIEGGTAPNVRIAEARFVTLARLTLDGGDSQAAPGVTAGSGALSVVDSTIRGGGEHDGRGGGGISVVPRAGHASVTVRGSTIAGNRSDHYGGGIFVDSGNTTASTLTVVNSTLTGNDAARGGGIALGHATLSLRAATVAGNTGSDGGGLFATTFAAGPIYVTGSILAGNTARVGGPGADCLTGAGRVVTDGGHNVIGQAPSSGPCSAFADEAASSQVGSEEAPLDPVLGPLAGNGGQTPTRALLAGSPAINAGDPSDCLASAVGNRDQRGVSRQAGNRVLCDAGAYDTHGVAVQTLQVSRIAASDHSCADASQPFRTLGGALECASNGTTIKLGSGTFAGQVTVPANVVLQGSGSSTVLRGPAGAADTLDPVLAVPGHRRVAVRDLVIDGGGQQLAQGIRAGSGALLLQRVTVRGGGTYGRTGGGGVAVVPETGRGALTVVASTISGNYSNTAGGGIRATTGPGATSPTPVKLANSTVADNVTDAEAGMGGGGISLGAASLDARSSTIAGNRSRTGGGGIHADRDLGRITLTNTIVAGNTGADCVSWNAGRPIDDGGHNVIGSNTGSAPTGCPGLVDGVNGTRVGTAAAPVDPLLGPLAANGGSTRTLAPLGGSPAIGHGDGAACRQQPVADRDQRGRARGSAARGACDVGAYDTGGAAS